MFIITLADPLLSRLCAPEHVHGLLVAGTRRVVLPCELALYVRVRHKGAPNTPTVRGRSCDLVHHFRWYK